VCPVLVGGGMAFFPAGAEAELALAEVRRFASGDLYLRYVSRL
jgi:hypothetical protein